MTKKKAAPVPAAPEVDPTEHGNSDWAAGATNADDTQPLDVDAPAAEPATEENS